jgi:hypothetical protein
MISFFTSNTFHTRYACSISFVGRRASKRSGLHFSIIGYNSSDFLECTRLWLLINIHYLHYPKNMSMSALRSRTDTALRMMRFPRFLLLVVHVSLGEVQQYMRNSKSKGTTKRPRGFLKLMKDAVGTNMILSTVSTAKSAKMIKPMSARLLGRFAWIYSRNMLHGKTNATSMTASLPTASTETIHSFSLLCSVGTYTPSTQELLLLFRNLFSSAKSRLSARLHTTKSVTRGVLSTSLFSLY